MQFLLSHTQWITHTGADRSFTDGQVYAIFCVRQAVRTSKAFLLLLNLRSNTPYRMQSNPLVCAQLTRGYVGRDKFIIHGFHIKARAIDKFQIFSCFHHFVQLHDFGMLHQLEPTCFVHRSERHFYQEEQKKLKSRNYRKKANWQYVPVLY